VKFDEIQDDQAQILADNLFTVSGERYTAKLIPYPPAGPGAKILSVTCNDKFPDAPAANTALRKMMGDANQLINPQPGQGTGSSVGGTGDGTDRDGTGEGTTDGEGGDNIGDV
jgi:hypothetical protein